jgi:hypothetical protein
MTAQDNLSPHQFAGQHPEQVRVSALMPHREYEHGPGFSRGMEGTQYAPKRSPEEWNDLVESIRAEGVQEPLSFAYDPKTHAGYVDEGNSRLAAASQAGLETVPVVGRKVSTGSVPDASGYRLPGEARIKRDKNGWFPGDFRVSGVLPARYMG